MSANDPKRIQIRTVYARRAVIPARYRAIRDPRSGRKALSSCVSNLENGGSTIVALESFAGRGHPQDMTKDREVYVPGPAGPVTAKSEPRLAVISPRLPLNP